MATIRKINTNFNQFYNNKSFNYNNQSSINSINANITNNTTNSFNNVETTDFNNNIDIKSILDDLEDYNDSMNDGPMTNTKTNPIESLSYDESNQLLEDLDDANLKTEDTARLLAELDLQSNSNTNLTPEQKEAISKKIDSTWNNLASKNNDNTLKYIHQAYVNTWHSNDKARIAAANYDKVDANAAIEEINSNMKDYDSSILNSVVRYGKSDSTLTSDSATKLAQIDNYNSSSVVRADSTSATKENSSSPKSRGGMPL